MNEDRVVLRRGHGNGPTYCGVIQDAGVLGF